MMNKKAQLFDFDFELNPYAAILAVIGGAFAFWYAKYLFPNAGLVMKSFSAILTLIIGYFIAQYILER